MLILLGLFAALVAASSFQPSNPLREKYSFDHDTKWNCFYRSSTPVKGLNPAIWRHDKFGSLIMAGLNYNCSGCLCYTFDHRIPLDALDKKPLPEKLALAFSGIHNCQVLSYRANMMKGSNEDSAFPYDQAQFGCDRKTMALFAAKDYSVCRELERLLLTEDRRSEIEKHYRDYLQGPYFFDPEKVGRSHTKYFTTLFDNAEKLGKKIHDYFYPPKEVDI